MEAHTAYNTLTLLIAHTAIQHSVKPQIGICRRFGSYPRFYLGLNIKYVTKSFKGVIKDGSERKLLAITPL